MIKKNFELSWNVRPSLVKWETIICLFYTTQLVVAMCHCVNIRIIIFDVIKNHIVHQHNARKFVSILTILSFGLRPQIDSIISALSSSDVVIIIIVFVVCVFGVEFCCFWIGKKNGTKSADRFLVCVNKWFVITRSHCGSRNENYISWFVTTTFEQTKSELFLVRHPPINDVNYYDYYFYYLGVLSMAICCLICFFRFSLRVCVLSIVH